MVNNMKTNNLHSCKKVIKDSALPRHVKIQLERKMFKTYCSRLKKYTFYINMKYEETL